MKEPITIQHLDEATADRIEEQAVQRGVDKEPVVLRLNQQAIELEKKKAELLKYRDLDSLAGTWSKEEADEFDRAIASLRTIDEDFWRLKI